METGKLPTEGPFQEVEISRLALIDSPRMAGEDPEHVQVLAAVQDRLPPIIVHRQTMRVIDGFHRVRAADARGQRTIPVRFFDGPLADAFVLAVEANVTHGLPLSTVDRKQAAGRILASHPTWSDRRIAAVTGIAPATVAGLRKATPITREVASPRIGKDGKVRPPNATDGRRKASELIAANPEMSLRQIARLSGISPETVRDVKSRLERGASPLPQAAGDSGAESRRAPRRLPRPQPGSRSFGEMPLEQGGRVVQRLRADPALRLNETGRELLRLMSAHLMGAEEWQRTADNVPLHCRSAVSYLARQYAELWLALADRMDESVEKMA
ncbi:ParB/RepB/Spo0J family partition protein [Actinomadura rupiterrae]|uniref:ParB/RepB/Spo0J family partition protein n=1 Tax=Actinomadura rupiterrae TaxID=559627 RepID=UPI0020A31FE9|nr:ParB N-terminal domain-containing protein [Actinomadura rupiterrae]MCP2342071.1 ParB-like chromosome segregation protein Spo0J [Actinomadura rupiterrae]